MAMVNLLNGKDSRWLQLEVCREFQRQKCSRPDTECKFAHPPANVEVQNGRVTACYDSIKVSLVYKSFLCLFNIPVVLQQPLFSALPIKKSQTKLKKKTKVLNDRFHHQSVIRQSNRNAIAFYGVKTASSKVYCRHFIPSHSFVLGQKPNKFLLTFVNFSKRMLINCRQ